MGATLDPKSVVLASRDQVANHQVSDAIEYDADVGWEATKMVALDHDSRGIRGGYDVNMIGCAEDGEPSSLPAKHRSTALDANRVHTHTANLYYRRRSPVPGHQRERLVYLDHAGAARGACLLSRSAKAHVPIEITIASRTHRDRVSITGVCDRPTNRPAWLGDRSAASTVYSIVFDIERRGECLFGGDAYEEHEGHDCA